MDDLADMVSFGSDRPRRPPPRWLIVVGVVVLAAAVLAVFVRGDRRGPRLATPTVASPTVPMGTGARVPCLPVGWAQSPAVADPVAGLLIERAGGRLDRDLSQERCDRTALDGPWTVVVRRPDGSLGKHGAVVTFPVAAPTSASSVDVNGVIGTAGSGEVTWPVAGAYARIRGDLGEAELIAIAARTTVVAGRPSVDPPAGYVVVSTGPYRPPTVHEVGYGSAAAGERAALGDGWIHTGVTSGGGFEDRLFAVRSDSGGLVHNRPAVVSGNHDGEGMLTWEPTPGVVAFVGYGYGAPLGDDAIAALRRLAGQTRVVTSTEWQAMHPVTVDQINDHRYPGPWPEEARREPGS